MKPFTAGIIAATVMSSIVATTLYLAGGAAHIFSELQASGPLYAIIIVSFGAQVAMLVERRARRAVAANSAGSGAVMVACCMHHVADFAPLAGLLPFLLPLAGVQQEILFAGALLSLAATAWMASSYATRTDLLGAVVRTRYPIITLIALTLTMTTYGGIL